LLLLLLCLMLFSLLIRWELCGCIDSEISLLYCLFYHLIWLSSIIIFIIIVNCVIVMVRWLLWLSHLLIFAITLSHIIIVIMIIIILIVISIIPSLHLWVHNILMLILFRSQHLWWTVYVLFITYPSLITIMVIKRLL